MHRVDNGKELAVNIDRIKIDIMGCVSLLLISMTLGAGVGALQTQELSLLRRRLAKWRHWHFQRP